MHIEKFPICPTLRAECGGHLPVICLQGNGIDRADTAGCNGKGWKFNCCYTLNTIDRPAVCYSLDSVSSMGSGKDKTGIYATSKNQGCFDVEMEVAVRKHKVDIDKLKITLREHKKTFSNKEISEKFNKPVTTVEHWFRQDDSFAIPDADVWFELKAMLNIQTDEFDKSITEFEYKEGSYDMRNRIYVGEKSPTLSCGCGNGLYLLPIPVICLQGNGIDRADTAGCNGRGWKFNCCYTLNTIDRPAVCYSLDSVSSNSMKSSNPNSGCHKTEKSKTLDTTNQDPSRNQGGIVICSRRNMECEKAIGGGINSMTTDCYALDRAFYNQGQNAQYEPQCYEDGTCPTLVAKGPGAVCHGIVYDARENGDGCTCPTITGDHNSSISDYTGICLENKSTMWNGEEVAPTLTANNAGGGQRMPDKDNFNAVIEYNEPQYIVRRLTPLECCRLQGFPDCWAERLDTPEPTEEDLMFWREVFETHRKLVTGASKSKTDRQIIKWLQNPYSDSAEYKMWGNGVALPNVYFVLNGIANYIKERDNT